MNETLAMLLSEAESADTPSDTDNDCTYFIFGIKGVLAGIFCLSGIAGDMSTYSSLFFCRRRKYI